MHIETRYVETDALNFRDVVQRLTGKNSSMTWVGNESSSLEAAGSDNKGETAQGSACARPMVEAPADGVNNSLVSSMVLKNMISFKDFDALLSDSPSMEELLCW